MNLFKAAEAKGATASSAPKKKEVVIADPALHRDVTRAVEIDKEISTLAAEKAHIDAALKERSIEEFITLYENDGKYPGSFNVEIRGKKNTQAVGYMFIPTDKYIKIDEERYNELLENYGENLVEKKVTYNMDATLVEKYGELLSDAIMKIKGISDEDKKKLITATNSYNIKNGTIEDLQDFGSIDEMVQEVKPVFQTKNLKLKD